MTPREVRQASSRHVLAGMLWGAGLRRDPFFTSPPRAWEKIAGSAIAIVAVACVALGLLFLYEDLMDTQASSPPPSARYAAIHVGQTITQVEAIMGGAPDVGFGSASEPAGGPYCMDYSFASGAEPLGLPVADGGTAEFCFRDGRLASKSIG